jgi:O-antigen/teichoic acid export membrane protein
MPPFFCLATSITSTYTGAIERKFDLRLLHSSISVFITQVVLQGAAFIPSVLISRRFGDDGKGLVTLLLYVPTVLYAVSSLGLSSAAQYFIGRKEGSRQAHLGNVLGLPLSAALLSFAAFTLSYSFWKPHLGEVSYSLMIPALIILPLTILLSHCTQVLIAIDEVVKRNACYLLQSLSTAVIVTALMLLPQASILGVLWAYIVGFSLGAGLALYYCVKLVGAPSLPSADLIWKTLKYGFWIYLAALFQTLFGRVSFFLLVDLNSMGDGGVFSAALALTAPLTNVPWAVQAVLLPRTAALSDEDANRTTPVYFRQVTIVMLILGLVVALFSRPLLALFGEEFIRGQSALLILLIGTVLAGQNTLLTTHILGRGKPQIMAIAVAVSLVTSIAFNYLLIPPMGLNGAALATTLPRALITAIAVYYFARVVRGDASELIRFRRSDLNVIADGLAWLKQSSIDRIRKR